MQAVVFTRTWRRRQPRLACGLPATPVARPRAPPEPSGGPCGVNNGWLCPPQVGPNDCCQPEPSVGPYQVPEVMEKIHMLETTFDCRPAVSSCSPESPTIQSSPPSTSVCGQTQTRKVLDRDLAEPKPSASWGLTVQPAGSDHPGGHIKPTSPTCGTCNRRGQKRTAADRSRAIGCGEGQDARPCPEGRAGASRGGTEQGRARRSGASV